MLSTTSRNAKLQGASQSLPWLLEILHQVVVNLVEIGLFVFFLASPELGLVLFELDVINGDMTPAAGSVVNNLDVAWRVFGQ
jgi:hypothetical protein